MIVDAELVALKKEALGEMEELTEMIPRAVKEGWTITELEREVWKRGFHIGQLCVQKFVDAHGTGDFGEVLEVEERAWKRLEKLHARRYVSIFGEISILRTIYGTRKAQKHEVVPLDSRLGLPEGDYSLILEGWAQEFCVNQSFAKTRDFLKRVLGIGVSVRTLEQMNRANARDAEEYQKTRPTPKQREGDQIHLLTADGKGIPMRRGEGEEPGKGRRKKGEKANKKREACVGASNLIDPYFRSPEEILEELAGKEKEESKERARPQDKRLRGELSREGITGKEATFGLLKEMGDLRDPEGKGPMMVVMDGAPALWKKAEEKFPGSVKILDFFHVSERVWNVAHIFHLEGSEDAEEFAKEKMLGILRGKAGMVVGGIRQMATKRGIKGKKRERLEKELEYLQNNKEHMKYDEYLARGYPIGSGVVEGACRNLVKDRFELTGMRLPRKGDQAMLRMRAISVNGEWDDFQRFRRKKVEENLYPYRDKFLRDWALAA